MKTTKSIIYLFVVSFVILIMSQFGCEEQNMSPRGLNPAWFQQPIWSNQPNARIAAQAPQVNRNRNNSVPRIKFEKVSHDFGRVSLGSNNFCEFKFTNTGDDILKINEVQETCDCTAFLLEKKEYAPDESGVVHVGYVADAKLGSIIEQLYVFSNDPSNPQVELVVKADHVSSVDFEPKKLDLMLMYENANCPKIIITSLDNQPFSITGFKSTGDCITANFNPSIKNTQFVIKPKVDLKKLELSMDGRFDINLSHPQCKTVTGTYSAPPRFIANPKTITINEAYPGEKIVKSVRIVSNYNEKFIIESLLSSKGIVKVIDQKAIPNGYELQLEITSPKTEEQTRTFTDIFGVNLQGIGTLRIDFKGFYGEAKSSRTSSRASTQGEVRGGVIINSP